MLRKVCVINNEEGIRPDCEPPFSVIEYAEDHSYAIVDTPHEVGEPASWDDVKNPIYKKIVVGDKAYSVGGRIPNTTPVYLDDKGRLCLLKIEEKEAQVQVEENGVIILQPTKRQVKKFITPPETPLAIRDGKLGVYIKDENGNEVFTTDPETELIVVETGEKIKLKDVKLLPPDA